LVTPCPPASRRFEAERFKLPVLRHENKSTKTNRSDGGCAPPNPHRSPRQAFGGNSYYGLPAASAEKKNEIHLSFSLHDYMPVICGLTIFRISEMSAFESLRKG